MNDITPIETEESLVPVIIATAVVTVAAVIAAKGLWGAVKTIKKNSEIKKAAKAANENTEETN